MAPPAKTERFDVLIVGAGISGIGGAYHLTKQCPGTSFVVLDALEDYGGTWRTHRFPGIRSDSDLYTFGYAFKPWTGAPIATAAEILRYMGKSSTRMTSARTSGIATGSLRRAGRAARISGRSRPPGRTPAQTVRFTANFLWMCQGYYRHSRGYTPEWDGMEAFKGPHRSPADLAGRPGLRRQESRRHRFWCHRSDAHSGDCGRLRTCHDASALADILQDGPQCDSDRRRAAGAGIDETWIHEIVRKKILYEQDVFTRRSFAEPEAVKQELLEGARGYLGPDYDVATHFTPRYRPWRQRIAFIPDGDLFQAVRAGKASVVTDEIDRFTQTGIRLKSGKVLEADIIVTATGFNLNVLGDIDFTIDGKPLAFSDTVTYRGTMFTGVPNMAWVFGYFRASWTLRADMIGELVCRLLNHMKKKGAKKVTPTLRPEDKDMQLLPWIDPENFNPGYLMRGMHLLPKRGDKPEWQHTQDYWAEKDALPAIDLDDAAFVYE